ncbi:hypothetical protein F5B19DRAFT_496196 [Rostrohypoxylon terebratum]|nr:hypothetical protein F5B19DRAFT_496196 [Rostrohypoxylon terebratum]
MPMQVQAARLLATGASCWSLGSINVTITDAKINSNEGGFSHIPGFHLAHRSTTLGVLAARRLVICAPRSFKSPAHLAPVQTRMLLNPLSATPTKVGNTIRQQEPVPVMPSAVINHRKQGIDHWSSRFGEPLLFLSWPAQLLSFLFEPA